MSDVINSAISGRDYVVVIDQSGSMTTADCPGNKTRWAYCQESVQALVSNIQKYDPDGVDCYFFNKKFTRFEGVTADKVRSVFEQNSPNSSTYFAPVLADIFSRHFDKSKRPTTVLFITDGEAVDPVETGKEIVKAAGQLESDNELAISFIQVGRDRAARDFLRKLDDDLKGAGAKFDIVDTVTMDDVDDKPLEEILFNAIVD